MTKSVRAVLIGNYGAGNIGDEALREYFVDTFSNVDWTVLTAQGHFPRLPCGLRSFFRPWWRTVRAIARSDVVVFGGGTLFTDIESLHACFLWGLHAFVARIFRRPYALAFQGVGPFHTCIGRRIARWVFRHASHISLRDPRSCERLASWDLGVPIVRTADPALVRFLTVKKVSIDAKILGVIPRKDSGKAFHDLVMRRAVGDWHSLMILLMEPDSAESAIAQAIATSASPLPCTIVSARSVGEFLAAIAQCHTVISMRYHGALAARALGLALDVLSQAPDDKLSTVMGMDFASVLARIEKGEKALRDFLSDCHK